MELALLGDYDEQGKYRLLGTMEQGLTRNIRKKFYEMAKQVRGYEDEKKVHIEDPLKCKVKV